MNFLLISSLFIASIAIFPAITHGSTTTEIEEQPHALPLIAAAVPPSRSAAPILQADAGEVWQEDDREVLIRSVRGAKNNNNNNNNNNNGNGSGKRERKRLNNTKKNLNAGENIHHKEKSNIQTEKPLRSEKRNKSQKKSPSCRYEKSQWTECNPETNIRTRVLTLKKGDEGCVSTRTIEKKCKKACRYDRGEWSKCVNGSMTRKDNIRPGCDASCKPTRDITKNCNKDKKNKKQEKNARKAHQQ